MDNIDIFKELLAMHEPKHYNVPDHLAKIFRSPEYAEAAKKAGKSLEAYQNEVAAELKKIAAEYRDAELAAFEKQLGAEALKRALAKFDGFIEAELKAVAAAVKAAEVKRHEDALAGRALAAVAKR